MLSVLACFKLYILAQMRWVWYRKRQLLAFRGGLQFASKMAAKLSFQSVWGSLADIEFIRSCTVDYNIWKADSGSKIEVKHGGI